MELAFNALLGIVFLMFAIMSPMIVRQSTAGDLVEAGGFPYMIAIIALVILVYSSYETIKQNKKADNAEKPNLERTKLGLKRMCLTVLWILLYILTIKYLSFTVATFLFVFLNTTSLGSKRYVFNAAFALVLTLALTIVFGRFFMITLPRGVGFIREFSYFLY